MSYILDALRKADAEREHGRVPDLQAQPLPPAVVDDEVAGSALPRWLGPALAGGMLAATAAWWFWPTDTPPAAPLRSPVAALPSPAAAPPAVAPPPAAAPSAILRQPARSAEGGPASAPPRAVPTGTPRPAPRAVPAPPVPVQTPAAAATRDATPAGVDAAPPAVASSVPPDADPRPPVPGPPPGTVGATPTATPVGRPATAPSASMGGAPTPADPRPARIPPLAELPEDLRRQVPAMAVGGSVYSPQPAARMVIVNGQVFQEGAVLGPELLLEQIRPKSAVFSIRGQRFEVPL